MPETSAASWSNLRRSADPKLRRVASQIGRPVQVDPIGPGVRCHRNCDAALLDIIGGNLNGKERLVGRTPQARLLDAIATVEIASDDQRRQSSVI